MEAIDEIGLLGSVLELCRVRREERIIVLTSGSDRQEMADLYLSALARVGVQAFQLNLAPRSIAHGASTKLTPLSGNTPAIDAMKAVDMVIDLVGLLWSPEQRMIQQSGTRILMSREPISVIARMLPSPALRQRVEAGVKRLANAKEMRITSRSGTDVRYQLGQYPAIGQYGYTDQPGRWDNLPGGFLYTGASETGVNGTVVIDVGDMILPFKRYVSMPIRLTISRGYIDSVDGDGLDAEFVRNYLAQSSDRRAYAISHIGWGMDEKARWDFLMTSPAGTPTTGADGRSFAGNVLFSTGPNTELGGDNDTPYHLDFPMKGCSLFLDGNPIVVDGTLVPEDLRHSES
ncbi:MAG: leucyl aminopeptidase [Hyphomicrobiaceae bacterium]